MFDSEVHRLDWLIREIEGVVANANLDPPSLERLDVFVVTSSWLETGLQQAKAILLLTAQKLSGAVGPLERALWELWIDWRYFLKVGDTALNAAKVLLNAKLELLEFMDPRPELADRSVLAPAWQSVEEFESQHAVASAQIRKQRREHRYHWSGKSRSAMERELAPNSPVYQLFSWESHSVMGPIRDLSVNADEGVVQFGRHEDEADINRRAWSTAGVLYYMYNDYASMWGLPVVRLPQPLREHD